MITNSTTYYDTPDAAVAVNYKAGSATLAYEIIKNHYKDLYVMIHTPPGTGNGVAYPAGRGPETSRWHGLCPKADDPRQKDKVLLLVRDPIERFMSACSERTVRDVDGILSSLEDGTNVGLHFLPQSRLLVEGKTKLFRFPDQFDDLAAEAGLAPPFVRIKSPRDKADYPLSPAQKKRLKSIYAEDFLIFKSMKL